MSHQRTFEEARAGGFVVIADLDWYLRLFRVTAWQMILFWLCCHFAWFSC